MKSKTIKHQSTEESTGTKRSFINFSDAPVNIKEYVHLLEIVAGAIKNTVDPANDYIQEFDQKWEWDIQRRIFEKFLPTEKEFNSNQTDNRYKYFILNKSAFFEKETIKKHNRLEQEEVELHEAPIANGELENYLASKRLTYTTTTDSFIQLLSDSEFYANLRNEAYQNYKDKYKYAVDSYATWTNKVLESIDVSHLNSTFRQIFDIVKNEVDNHLLKFSLEDYKSTNIPMTQKCRLMLVLFCFYKIGESSSSKIKGIKAVDLAKFMAYLFGGLPETYRTIIVRSCVSKNSRNFIYKDITNLKKEKNLFGEKLMSLSGREDNLNIFKQLTEDFSRTDWHKNIGGLIESRDEPLIEE